MELSGNGCIGARQQIYLWSWGWRGPTTPGIGDLPNGMILQVLPQFYMGTPKKEAKIAFTHKDPYKKQEIRFGQNETIRRASSLCFFFPEKIVGIIIHHQKRETLQKTPRITLFLNPTTRGKTPLLVIRVWTPRNCSSNCGTQNERLVFQLWFFEGRAGSFSGSTIPETKISTWKCWNTSFLLE